MATLVAVRVSVKEHTVPYAPEPIFLMNSYRVGTCQRKGAPVPVNIVHYSYLEFGTLDGIHNPATGGFEHLEWSFPAVFDYIYTLPVYRTLT